MKHLIARIRSYSFHASILLACLSGLYAPPVRAAASCPNNATLTAVTPQAGWARMGAAFGSTLYNPAYSSNNTTDNPQKIKVRVSARGQAVVGCAVNFSPSNGSAASGWVYPDSPVTGEDGTVSAWWIAGSNNWQAINATMTRANGTTSTAMIQGNVAAHTTRANSVHIGYYSPSWDRFSIDVTPQSFPASTYYMAIGWNDGYSGIQPDRILFSIWAINGVDPIVIDKAGSTCQGFGGEGTGIQCFTPYKPKAGVTYHFDAETRAAANGMLDVSIYVTDTSGSANRFKVATMRYTPSSPYAMLGANSFVEDYGNGQSSCLKTATRTAHFSNIRYRDAATGQTSSITSGWGYGVYTPDHNEVCKNYQFSADAAGFTASTGGSSAGAPLDMPNGQSIQILEMPAQAPAIKK
ncbi:DUF3472 domain-containing protein [Burkholderiaceae bacterium DAT-1]|nr:DUF3472 domain-containing protein [Burkholderiaceae bacterium DAT-1]